MELVLMVTGVVIGYLARSLTKYAEEKGKNLATREDIAAITGEIEKTRSVYQQELERLRVQIQLEAGQISSHRERAELALLSFFDAALAIAIPLRSSWLKIFSLSQADLRAYAEHLDQAFGTLQRQFFYIRLTCGNDIAVVGEAEKMVHFVQRLEIDLTTTLTELIQTRGQLASKPATASTASNIRERDTQLATHFQELASSASGKISDFLQPYEATAIQLLKPTAFVDSKS